MILGVIIVLVLGAAAFAAYQYVAPTAVQRTLSQLRFDDSASSSDQQAIRQAIATQAKTTAGSVKVHIKTTLSIDKNTAILEAYVPVTAQYDSRQIVTKADLATIQVSVPTGTDDTTRTAIASTLGLNTTQLKLLSATDKIADGTIEFVPVSQLSPKVKLLNLEGSYYLDSFSSGAVFRQAVFSSSSAASLSNLKLASLPSKDATLKVNMTGVTALTRVMMNKLASVSGPTYFSEKIGSFLADADITHVSNEVSFKAGCEYSRTTFCAPPTMIETLKASGVDVVELTGNHNNDVGNQYNTDTINLYHSLGWHTFGGGLNTDDAAKPYIADKKKTKVAFVGYNAADSPTSGVIATSVTAGGNTLDLVKAKLDIAAAKKQSDFVIVDVQFYECYAYPDGYVEYPVCDAPIAGQTETFRNLIDLGADMVIGTQAHQPQTYEFYKGKPIYYGLGNLYFDQTQWPGTERGIILTHYFVAGKLMQTKLSPTVYDEDLQTHLMSDTDAVMFLERLNTARP
jgi:poly-gamma-glutamate synthesis protein (capsule biosynthesis protein)